MINDQRYVILSLELHLFFARIMKEHSLFLESGFVTKDSKLELEADHYKREFEKLLGYAISASNGVIRDNILKSGEIVTDYTLGTEQKTQNLTGIDINQNLTVLESKLRSGNDPKVSENLINYVNQLRVDIETKSNKETELFWDQIMMEHSLFIRGLLDPSENKLIETANEFADDFEDLIKEARNMTDATINSMTDETLEKTIELKNFKQAGTEGIASCKIRSIILPLLADHVLREANHYIRILESYKRK